MRTRLSITLLLSLCACTATPPEPAPPPGAAGKIAPEMVGKLSPIPAFMGLGEHFNIELHAEEPHPDGAYRHRVHLIWGSGSHQADGTLFYRTATNAQPSPSGARAPFVLEGQLDTLPTATPIRVEISSQACTDDADQTHPQSVVITLNGSDTSGATTLHGCGDLAVY